MGMNQMVAAMTLTSHITREVEVLIFAKATERSRFSKGFQYHLP